MAEHDPTAPPDPALFEIEGRAVTSLEVLRAADVRGELEPVWRNYLAGLSASDRAAGGDLEIEATELERRSDDLRYERGLITAEEAEDWLDARALSFEDLSAYVLRCAWRDREPADSGGPSFAACDAADKERFRKEVTLSGDLDRLTHELARRMAVYDGGGASYRGTTEAIGRERGRFLSRQGLGPADLAPWLRGAGLRPDELDRLLAMEVAYEGRRESVLTAKAREGVRQSMRIPLTRVDVEAIEVASLDAAREVRCCVLDDGTPMAALAAEQGLRFARRSIVLEDLEPERQNVLLSAAPNDVLAPTPTEGGFEVARLIGKREPDVEDPETLRRIDRELLDAHAVDLVARRVRWRLRVEAPA